MEQKEKKIFGKLNIIDFIVVILLVLAVAFVGYKLARRGSGGSEAARCKITYTVRCEGVAAESYEAARRYVPSQVMASGVRYDVWITGVEAEPYLVLESGRWTEDPEHVNVTFTLEGTVANNEILTSDVGGQEVRIGKSDYIVKSEYLEFGSGIVTDVVWERPGE